MSYGPRSCSWRLRASTTTRSGPVWTPAARSSPSGANASSPSGSAASRSDPGEDGQASFPPEVVIEVKAIACELPSRLGLPLSRLQVPDIRDEVITRGLVAAISGTTIWRWLAEDAIRPWSHRSWIFPRAPDFEASAGRKPGDAGRARVRAWWGAGLLRRLGRAPGQAVRALRADHRHRAVQASGGPGDGKRAVRLSQAGVLGGRQRQLASGRGLGPAPGRRLAPGAAGPHPCPLVVVEPGGDLPVDCPAQMPHAQRLHRLGRSPAAPARLRAPLRAGGQALRVEVHPRRPRPAHQ